MSTSFTTEAFSLLGVGLAVIGLRTFLRWKQVGIRAFQADDYMILVAAVVYSVETYLAYSVGAYWQGLANNAMTEEERKNLQSSSPEFATRVNGSKTQLAGWSTYTLLLWLLKACMCCFYLRLTAGLDGFPVKIYIGFALVISTWLAVLLGILLGCGLSFEKNWQIHPDPGNFCQPAVSRIDIYMTVVLNVLTDFYLMSIPLPLLWKARVSGFKKFALLFCFSGGLFVTVAGILRCVLIVTDNVNGAQLAGSWAVRETFVAVVTTNLPMLSSIIQSCLRGVSSAKIRSWFALSSARASHERGRGRGKRVSEQTGEPDSIQLQKAHGDSVGRQHARELKSLYHITALSESEERIMGAAGQSMQQEMIREQDEASIRNSTSGKVSQVGGIQQKVEVTVTRGPSQPSTAALERGQVFGFTGLVQPREDVGTSTACRTGCEAV